ncbi:MAG: hypothetical protein WCF90_07845 [Methanomicrobiales archaeon]
MCDTLQKPDAVLPEPAITYVEAFTKIVHNEVKHILIENPGNHIVATGIFPYPLVIPILSPGERTGKQNRPVLQYLKSLLDFDKHFPGFELDTHGIKNVKGKYMMYCVKEQKQ